MSGKRKVKQGADVQGEKQPKIYNSPDKFYDQAPVWSFSRCDFDHDRWGFSKSKDRLVAVLKKLRDLEGQTWGEILCDTTARRNGTRSHPIETDKIIKEAQARLSELNLDYCDVLYSITLASRERIWGFMDRGTLSIIWDDEKHEIYPVNRRHT